MTDDQYVQRIERDPKFKRLAEDRGRLELIFTSLILIIYFGLYCLSLLRQTFGFSQALFPYDNPGLFSMIIGFGGIWLVSVLDRSVAASRERAAFAPQYVRSQTGLGIATAAKH